MINNDTFQGESYFISIKFSKGHIFYTQKNFHISFILQAEIHVPITIEATSILTRILNLKKASFSNTQLADNLRNVVLLSKNR